MSLIAYSKFCNNPNVANASTEFYPLLQNLTQFTLSSLTTVRSGQLNEYKMCTATHTNTGSEYLFIFNDGQDADHNQSVWSGARSTATAVGTFQDRTIISSYHPNGGFAAQITAGREPHNQDFWDNLPNSNYVPTHRIWLSYAEGWFGLGGTGILIEDNTNDLLINVLNDNGFWTYIHLGGYVFDPPAGSSLKHYGMLILYTQFPGAAIELFSASGITYRGAGSFYHTTYDFDGNNPLGNIGNVQQPVNLDYYTTNITIPGELTCPLNPSLYRFISNITPNKRRYKNSELAHLYRSMLVGWTAALGDPA